MHIGTDASRSPGVQLLEDEDFVWSRVWPLVSGGARRPPRSSFELTLHRRREDGRAVAEYTFDGSIRVFAKLFPDDAAGRAVHRIHDELCKHGFGPGSPYRVPEPIAYLGEDGVLLVQAAAGDNLAATEAVDPEAFREGVTRAAGWLAALHSSPVAVGPRETVADGVSRLERRVAKAIAACADLEDVFRAALAELEGRCAAAGNSGAYVQTHGRYHAVHLFMAPQCVTAIDLDRAALADPAKDVGEFLFVLRAIATARRDTDVAADDSCERFLDEYARQQPAPLSGLSFYWSYSVLWALLRLALKDRPSRRGWAERVELLRAEFDSLPRRVAASV